MNKKQIIGISWIHQKESENIELVGGKTANLKRLNDIFPVPPGFCLTSDFFSKTTQASAEFPEFSKEILKTIEKDYEKLCEICGVKEVSVAVRSSAADEDGHQLSFAGQYDTFLNICGLKAVSEAVYKCYKSAFSEQVKSYSDMKKQVHDVPKMAVLIQQLVVSDISAVVFSINPVTHNRNEIVINANWGLGESIVDGQVTPDTYIVNKMEMTIQSIDIAEKQKMNIIAADGTQLVPVPRLMANQQVIADEQIIQMAQMALQIEKNTNWYADIECAWKDDKLYLLQCRPVTSIDKRTNH
jgi:pyruvate,water dikinase